MQQVTIGTKNQIVIPKQIRQKFKTLKPGAKVSLYPLDNETVAIRIAPLSWVSQTKGLMTKAWKDIDPIQELEKMRDEWENKVVGHEKNHR